MANGSEGDVRLDVHPVVQKPREPELLTSREVQAFLKVSRASLFRFLDAGMPSIGKGRFRRFDRATTLRWFERTRSRIARTPVVQGHRSCLSSRMSLGRVHSKGRVREMTLSRRPGLRRRPLAAPLLGALPATAALPVVSIVLRLSSF
jgi:hypothetical protein